MRKASAQSTRAATIGGIGAILLWSTAVAVSRSLAEQVGPVTAATAVYSVSGVAGLLSLLSCRQRRQHILHLPPRYLVGCGALFVGYTLLLYLAIGWAGNRQQVVEVALLNYLWPVLTLVLSLALLGKKAGWGLVPGTLLAISGVFLVITQAGYPTTSSSPAGDPAVYPLALAAALAWALYSNLTRRWASGEKQGAVVLFLPVTGAALLLVCPFLNEPRQWCRQSLAEALFLGVTTYAAYALWDKAMRKGNIVLVAAASYLTPLLSTLVVCLYLNVQPHAKLWVGCVMLVLGSLLSWRTVTRATPATPRPELPPEPESPPHLRIIGDH